jgi:carboxyl-terminal processing protease
MLKIIKDDLNEHYYDPTFHGVKIEDAFKAAEEKIKVATANSQVFTIIAQTLMQLDDSHTFFLSPPRGFKVEYGWHMQIFGDAAYVSVVKPGSDAESKGLKPGDLIQNIDGFTPNRQNGWILTYLFNSLSPRSAQRLVVQSPGGQPRQLDINSKVKETQKLLDLTAAGQRTGYVREREAYEYLNRHRFQELNNDLLIWKMPSFDLTEKELEGTMKRVKKFKNVILDLRGNGGGYIETMRHMVGYFHESEIKICDLKGRNETKPVMSKKAGAFDGKLVVLIDSNSASASEMFSRVMQMEKRGLIIGDRSSGSVMMSRHYQREMGTDTVVFYGTSITEADVIMTDGKSLEHIGVTPDEIMIPTPQDLAAGRDPVLARAIAVLGFNFDPEKAGALFPVEWPR